MPSLEELAREIAVCQRCPLARGRTHAVPGDGNPQAEIVFVGEGPGFHEDRQGKPFVGPAGQLLNELLASIQLERSSVFITNVVKCRPPGNRDPLPNEIEACDYWLQQQLAVIKPKLVVTLGRFSMARFFGPGSISKLHGTTTRKNGLTVLALYHPAAALHNPSLRDALFVDFQKIPPLLATLRARADTPETEGPPRKPEPPAQQLSLF